LYVSLLVWLGWLAALSGWLAGMAGWLAGRLAGGWLALAGGWLAAGGWDRIGVWSLFWATTLGDRIGDRNKSLMILHISCVHMCWLYIFCTK
jgi:hypothetical protein